MEERCEECGVVWVEGRSCQSVFDECMGLELTDAEYGKVHMITVACFMVQHGRYSDEGMKWIKGQLREHLSGVSVEYIRRRAHGETQQGKRGWKVLRGEGAEPLPKVEWSVTMIDVVPVLGDAEGYCEVVKKWGRATLEEMEFYLGGMS